MRASAVMMTAVLLGCGGPDLRTLTRDDVSGVPAGNAVGAQFAGDYLVTRNQVEACRCRVGSCIGIHGNVGGTLSFSQMDGALLLTDPVTGETAPGGVDMDGRFRIGFLREQPNDIQYA